MLDARYLSLVPVSLLLGGALVLWLGGPSMGHHTKYVTALAIGSVALIALTYLAFLPQPYDTTVSPWLAVRRLSLGFDYHGDGLAIYPGIFALGAALILILFSWAARLTVSANQLALILASLAAFTQLLLSGNLLLLYLSWEALALLLVAQTLPWHPQHTDQEAPGLLLGLNQLPSLGLLLGALLIAPVGDSFVVSLVPPAALGIGIFLLIMVAGGARGGLYPLHAWLVQAFTQAKAPAGGLLIILAPLAGLYLLTRFVLVAGPGLGAETWLLMAGFLSAILLPFLASEQDNHQRALAYLIVAQGAFAVVALAIGANANLWRQMVSLVLGTSLLYTGWLAGRSGRGLGPWLAWLGALSLMGLPSPTIGFGARWELFNILWGKGHFLGVGLGLISQAISVAVLFRIMRPDRDQTAEVAGQRWQPQIVLLLLGGLAVALEFVPALLDNYVIAPALTSLSLEPGPEASGVFWNLGLMVLALPLGLALGHYGQQPLLSWRRRRVDIEQIQVSHILEPLPWYKAGGRVLLGLARWMERAVTLVPQQPPLATALMIGIFILFFMVG